VTAFIESVTGVQAGGRTGLTSIRGRGCFVLALFVWPVFVIIRPRPRHRRWSWSHLHAAGAGAIDLADLVNAVPVVLMLLITVLSNNLINGMAIGTFAYILLCLASAAIRPSPGGLGARRGLRAVLRGDQAG